MRFDYLTRQFKSDAVGKRGQSRKLHGDDRPKLAAMRPTMSGSGRPSTDGRAELKATAAYEVDQSFARPRRTGMPDDSGIDERQEIRIDRIGLRGGHAVWEAFIGFQGAVLQQFRAQRPRVGIRYDLIIVAVHH